MPYGPLAIMWAGKACFALRPTLSAMQSDNLAGSAFGCHGVGGTRRLWHCLVRPEFVAIAEGGAALFYGRVTLQVSIVSGFLRPLRA